MNIFTSHPHWAGVKSVCETLQKSGFIAWLAGGSVRDGIMGRVPNDFDVATDARPEQVEALFEKSVSVGKEFGVIVIPFQRDTESYQVEVATFRRDGQYIDGRHPENVNYSNAKEDARRRDFTINALFYDLSSKKVMDYVEGEQDIQGKILQTVGEPQKRFSEDKLRILRAVRFIAQLDFELCSHTQSAIKNLAGDLTSVSDERKRDELLKLLRAPYRQKGLSLLLETDLLKVLFKEYVKDKWAWKDIFKFFDHYEGQETDTLLWCLWLLPWSRTLGALGEVKERVWIVSKVMKKKIEKRIVNLKLSKHQTEQIVYALTHFDTWALREQLRRGWQVKFFVEGERAGILRELVRRVELAQGRWDVELCEFEESLVRAGADLSQGRLPSALVDGQWLKEQGVSSGKKMGQVLEELYLLQLEGVIYSLKDAEKWIINQKEK